MFDKHVIFFEGPFVQQHLDAFPRGQLAATVLRVDTLLATTKAGLRATFFEFLQYILHDFP